MLLENKTALITGAATESGIGFAIAKLFADHGARIAILDLDGEGAVRAAGALPGTGHTGYALDVTDPEACDAAVKSLAGEFGQIDVLVNVAGLTQKMKYLDIDQKNYDLVVDVNLRGTFNLCQSVIPFMQSAGGGSIINMSSAAAQRGGGFFGGAHYAAAKAGVLGLTKAIAREFGVDGIRANAVCPSMVETDFFQGQMTDEKRAELRAAVPLGRLGRPSDIAGCSLYLASDLSAYVTGSEQDVNGGTHIH